MNYKLNISTIFNVSLVFGPGLEKNLGFFGCFFRFLGFLGFNVHNAEHRYMTHDK